MLLSILASSLLLASLASAQTTVFSDDFSTNTSATYTTSGAIGASAWSVTRSGADWGARRNTSPAQLEQTNDVGATANVAGWAFAATPLSGFTSPYSTTLSSNPGVVTWTFNFRTNRTSALAGFSSTTSYGMAYILVSTSNTPDISGSGYAVVMGGGANNNIALIKYTSGLQGTRTTVIGFGGTPTNLTDYLSVKVTYDPSTNGWQLFSRDDGTTAFADPAAGTLTSIGTATDTTHTGTAMSYLGAYWQGSTVATQTAFFDNAKVTVVSAGATPPTLTAAVGATVDAPFNVTFTDDAAWRAAITSITVGGTTLTAGSAVSAGQITFTPSASNPANLLQSPGTKTIAVIATGYNNATVSQTIAAGAPNKLTITTQPTAPASNGAALATQPVVAIQDQYGNATTSVANVTAAVGAGTWTLGGTTTKGAVSGTATFTDLTATSSAAVTGATIAFSSSGLTGATSNAFNIPAPPPSITTSTTSLAAFSTTVGTPSASQSFTASGSNLTANITVTPPSGYALSTDDSSFSTSPLTLTQSGGSVPTTTIYVRLTGAAVGSPAGNVSLTSTGATTKNVAVTGTVSRAPISGSFNVGAGQTYVTLTAAISDINNNRTLTGAVTLLLKDATYAGETFPITINTLNGGSATNTLTIKPDTGVTSAISGTISSALIILNGADFVTIDGSNAGSSSRDLTLTNTNSGTSSAVLWLQTATADGATNNTVKNVNLVGNSNTSTLFGIGSGSSTISTSSTGTGNNNNTIQNCNVSKTQYGIFSQGNSTTKNTGNAISQNNVNTASPNNVQFGAILVGYENNITISNNSVAGITTTGDCFGISVGLGTAFSTTTTVGNEVTNATVSRNSITSVVSTSTTGFTAIGIGVSAQPSGSTTVVSNNMISGVLSFATSPDFIGGIHVGGGAGTTNVYFNSVYLSGSKSSGTLGGTSPSYSLSIAGSTPVVDIRDNALENTQTSGNGSPGKSFAIGLAYTSTAGNYANLTSNNNDFYVSGAQGVLAKVGSLSQGSGTEIATLGTWQTTTGRDGASVNGDPQFISTSNLHINTSVTTPVESAGAPVGGITADFDGDTRNTTTPDIGADEGTFIAPVSNDIQATAFIDPTNGGLKVANVAFSPQASFTNNGTVQTNVPVRYRICTDGTCTTELYNNATTIASISNGVTTTVTFASVSGGLSAGTYTIKAKAELVGDAVPGNDEITGTVVIEAPLSGSYTVGAGGNYTTVTQAVGKLNTLGVSGAVILNLTDASYSGSETFPITINAVSGASATNTITIKPASGVSPTINGTATGTSIFKLNGADFVTIDGSNNGSTSRDLTISNTSTAANTAAIWIASLGTGAGAADNIIKNCNIAAGSNSTNVSIFAIFVGGTSISTTGTGADNDNLTLQNNSITRTSYGIYASGTAASSTGGLDGLSITSNLVGPSTPSGSTNIGFSGIYLSNTVSVSVNGNTVRNLTTSSSSSSGGIYVSASASPIVSSNTVTAVSTSASATGGGIYLTGTVSSAVVSQNTVSSFSSSSTASQGGIYLTGAISSASITQNTVTNVSSSALVSTTSAIAGIYVGSGVTNSTISRNILTGLSNTNTGGYGVVGILVNTSNATSNDTISNNFISDVFSYSDPSTDYWPFGIAILGTSAGINVYHNSVNLFGSHLGLTTGTGAAAMFVNTTATTPNLDIRDNIFSNSYDNSSSSTDKAYAIYSVNAATAFTNIDYNDYYVSGTGTPVLGFLGSDKTTIAAWKTATGKDASSIAADPSFTSTTDLHITSAASPVANTGTTISGITVDIDGDTRGNPPYIGADERIASVAATGTLGAFSTTYGTASAAQTLGVTGTNVSANVTATAPAGYEVSNDGSSYGPTATFTASGGSASGTLHTRLTACTKPSDTLGTNMTLSSVAATTQNITVSGSVAKATPSITATGSTSFTYNQNPQGPSGSTVMGVCSVAPSGAVTFSYEGTGGTTYGPSATQPTNAGTYQVIASIASDANYEAASSSPLAFTINPKALTITPNSGQFKIKGASDPTLTYSQSGLISGDSITGALSRVAGEGAGLYPITQNTLTAGTNYSISFTSGVNFIIAGAKSAADGVARTPGVATVRIAKATLLANDSRVATDGSTQTDTLSLTAVTAGGDNSVTMSGAFVFFTANNPNDTGPSTFTYTLSESTNSTTDTGTVTVTPTAPGPFALDIVEAGTATYNGVNTTITVGFISVPGQSVMIEYSSPGMSSWTTAGVQGNPVSTGSGSFQVTITLSGDHTADWNTAMFFRGTGQ